MITYLIETFLIAIGAGTFAGVYYSILRSKAPQLVQKFMADHEGKWWLDPIWECICCIGGQCGLWAYMMLEVTPALFGSRVPALARINNPMAYVLGLILSITLSMLTGMLVTRVISWLNKTTVNFK